MIGRHSLQIVDHSEACHQLVDQCLDGCVWNPERSHKDYDILRTHISKEGFPSQWMRILYALLAQRKCK